MNHLYGLLSRYVIGASSHRFVEKEYTTMEIIQPQSPLSVLQTQPRTQESKYALTIFAKPFHSFNSFWILIQSLGKLRHKLPM